MPRSALLDLPGAVEADTPDGGVAAHYGSPVPEQRRLESGSGFVDLSHRDVFAVRGDDRVRWLHDLCTQDFENVTAGEPVDSLILSPQGRIEHAFTGRDDGETFWAHAEPAAGAPLIDFLNRMKFMMRVDVEPVGDRVVVGLAHGGWELVERADLAEVSSRFGEPSGLWAWEALRIAAGRVRVGIDTDDKTIPNEVGLLGVSVALEKGCYRGQETVARVHTLGRPPRRLVRLHLDGSADRLPARGADVVLGEQAVGFVGSTARHHELGPIALALVKRSVDASAEFQVEGIAASQEVLVDPEVGLHVRPQLGAS